VFAAALFMAGNAFGQQTNESADKVPKESASEAITTAVSSSVVSKKNPFAARANSGTAPQDPSTSDSWEFEVAPYLWAAALKGDLRVRNSTAHVDASFSDLFKQLDFAFAVKVEAAKRRWRIIVDQNYMNLGTTGRGPLTENVGIEPTLNFLEGSASYAPFIRRNENSTSDNPLPPFLSVEILGGARYTHFGLGLEPANAAPVEGSRNLVDVFVGNRIKASPHPVVTLIGKYTVGGGGSHFAWTVSGLGELRFRKNMSVWGGYQVLGMDADKPSNTVGFHGQLRGLIFGLSFYK